MPSFESTRSIFVHVPKAAGKSIFYTARKAGQVVRIAPPVRVHQPASYFASDKPAWCLIRHPHEWYVSLWRFYVDTNWQWEEFDRRGLDFPEWMDRTIGRYTAELLALDVPSIPHRWRAEDAQAAFDAMIGPHPLLRRNISRADPPTLSPEHRRRIEATDGLAFELYESAAPIRRESV